MRSLFVPFFMWFTLLGPSACQRTYTPPSIPAPPSVSAEEQKKGAELFAQHCARCHGISGWGDGPDAFLSRRFRVQDLGDPMWQANASNDRIVAAILRGGLGVRKSSAMPAFPQFTQNRKELDGLVAHIRSLVRETAK